MREHSLGAERNLSQSIPEDQARELAQAGSAVELAKGEAAYHQGDTADGIYLLQGGRIKSSSVNAVGNETVLRIHIPGSIIGLTAIGHEPIRDATASALEDCQLIFIEREKMLGLMRENGELGVYIAQLLLDRLSSFHFRVHEVLTNTVEQRVARALLGFSMPVGDEAEPHLLLSQEELSQIVAARRPTVSQILGQFTDAGLIRVERRRIVLLDPSGLARFLPI